MLAIKLAKFVGYLPSCASDCSHQEALLSRSSALRGSGHGVSTAQTESFIGVLDMFGFEKLQVLNDLSIWKIN